MGSFLRDGGGVCMSLSRKKPKCHYHPSLVQFNKIQRWISLTDQERLERLVPRHNGDHQGPAETPQYDSALISGGFLGALNEAPHDAERR